MTIFIVIPIIITKADANCIDDDEVGETAVTAVDAYKIKMIF